MGDSRRAQDAGADHDPGSRLRCRYKSHCVGLKVNPDYEILFRLMEGLQPDAGRRYWIQEHGAEVDIGDIGEELGQMETEVKIAFSMSHNVLTGAEEYVK